MVFAAGTPVSSTNKTDSHDITEILLKAALNTRTLILNSCCGNLFCGDNESKKIYYINQFVISFDSYFK